MLNTYINWFRGVVALDATTHSISIPIYDDHDAMSSSVSRNADSFAYNARGEVATATAVGGLPSPVAATYAYDLIGNVTLAAHGSLTNAYSANSLNQHMSILRASVRDLSTARRRRQPRLARPMNIAMRRHFLKH